MTPPTGDGVPSTGLSIAADIFGVVALVGFGVVENTPNTERPQASM
jgi:hypothetical protein